MSPLNSFAKTPGYNKFFNAAILLTVFFVALTVVRARVSTFESELDPEGKVINRSEVQKRLRETTGKAK